MTRTPSIAALIARIRDAGLSAGPLDVAVPAARRGQRGLLHATADCRRIPAADRNSAAFTPVTVVPVDVDIANLCSDCGGRLLTQTPGAAAHARACAQLLDALDALAQAEPNADLLNAAHTVIALRQAAEQLPDTVPLLGEHVTPTRSALAAADAAVVDAIRGQQLAAARRLHNAVTAVGHLATWQAARPQLGRWLDENDCTTCAGNWSDIPPLLRDAHQVWAQTLLHAVVDASDPVALEAAVQAADEAAVAHIETSQQMPSYESDVDLRRLSRHVPTRPPAPGETLGSYVVSELAAAVRSFAVSVVGAWGQRLRALLDAPNVDVVTVWTFTPGEAGAAAALLWQPTPLSSPTVPSDWLWDRDRRFVVGRLPVDVAWVVCGGEAGIVAGRVVAGVLGVAEPADDADVLAVAARLHLAAVADAPQVSSGVPARRHDPIVAAPAPVEVVDGVALLAARGICA